MEQKKYKEREIYVEEWERKRKICKIECVIERERGTVGEKKRQRERWNKRSIKKDKDMWGRGREKRKIF